MLLWFAVLGVDLIVIWVWFWVLEGWLVLVFVCGFRLLLGCGGLVVCCWFCCGGCGLRGCVYVGLCVLIVVVCIS